MRCGIGARELLLDVHLYAVSGDESTAAESPIALARLYLGSMVVWYYV